MFTLKNLPPTMRQSLLSAKRRSSIRKEVDNISSTSKYLLFLALCLIAFSDLVELFES